MTHSEEFRNMLDRKKFGHTMFAHSQINVTVLEIMRSSLASSLVRSLMYSLVRSFTYSLFCSL